MPAVDARDDTVHVRAVRDIDKTVKELASDGKIPTDWIDREPPEG